MLSGSEVPLLLPPAVCACGLESPKLACAHYNRFAFALLLEDEANQLASVSLFRDGRAKRYRNEQILSTGDNCKSGGLFEINHTVKTYAN